MKTQDDSLRSLRYHLAIGMAVGLAVCLALGFLNALLVMGGTASWVKQFVQGAVVPEAAKASLLKSTPIFAISAASNGLLGLLLGALWGALVWAWLRLRGRFPAERTEALALHIASFVAFPVFLLTLLVVRLLLSGFVKDAPPLTAPRVLLNLAVVLVLAGLGFFLGRLVLRLLLPRQPLRFLVSGKGYAIVSACYLVLILLLSYLPPLLALRGGDEKLALSCGGGGDRESGTAPPNILLVVLDTTRADHLSAYGYPRPTTPLLDKFAQEGVLYEEAYSAAVWTLAGHASIFTGMVPSKSGANAEHLYLESSFVTLAEVLRACGYRTAGFCNNAWVSEFTGLDQGFDHYRKMWFKEYGVNFLVPHGLLQAVRMLYTEVQPPGGVIDTTEEALEWILRDREKPFLAFLNLMEAHPPLDYRPQYTDLFLPEGNSAEAVKRVNQNPYTLWARKATLTPEDRASYEALYDGELRYLDEHLGRFFERLRTGGVLDDTLVIVTADHGELLGEAGFLGHHFSVREGLLRVPLIIRYPRLFPAGVRCPERVQTLDILPTLLEVLGVREPAVREPLQGQSLYPPCRQREGAAFAEEFRPLLEIKFVKAFQPEFDVDQAYAHRRMTWVEGNYKYVRCESGEEELYDLGRDPGETRNLTGSQPEVLAKMRDGLKQWLASFEPFEIRQGDYSFEPDKATEEQLRSLGYVQ